MLQALLYFKPRLQTQDIHAMTVRTDNMVTMHNLRRQRASGGLLLQKTQKIFSLLTKLDIRIFPEHIPGVQNTLTDALSRMHKAGDYVLRKEVFEIAVKELNVQPTIDLFADMDNHKVQRFMSIPGRRATGSCGLWALNCPWKGEVPYAFPPVQLIPKVIQKLRLEVRQAILVVPEWPSLPWWNLMEMSARKIKLLGPSDLVLVKGPSMPQDRKLPPGMILMVHMSFD